MAIPFPSPKDPDEVLDYYIDWSLRLAGDTIQTSTWSATAGITVGTGAKAPSFTPSVTKVWLSGGTLNQSCGLLNSITTMGGRTMEQTAELRIRAK